MKVDGRLLSPTKRSKENHLDKNALKMGICEFPEGHFSISSGYVFVVSMLIFQGVVLLPFPQGTEFGIGIPKLFEGFFHKRPGRWMIMLSCIEHDVILRLCKPRQNDHFLTMRFLVYYFQVHPWKRRWCTQKWTSFQKRCIEFGNNNF